MKKPLLVLLAGLSLVAGCASMRDPDDVAERVRITQDDYSQTVIFRGPRFHTGSIWPWDREQWVHLRVVKAEHGRLDRQLVVEFDRTLGWAYFGTAYDRMGHPLNVNGLGLLAPCPNNECFYSDTVAISLPPGYLESYVTAGRGLDIKLYGLMGEVKVKVPAGYVAGFVHALNR